MKVLKAGKDKSIWTIKHTCTGWGNGDNGCDALLEIEFADLKYHKGFLPDWSVPVKDPKVSFQCPCCSTITDLGMNDWPKNYTNIEKYPEDWIKHIQKEAA